jgi:hypothetical protein
MEQQGGPRSDSVPVLTTGSGAHGRPMAPVPTPNKMPGNPDLCCVGATFARTAIAVRMYIAAPVSEMTPMA